MNTETRPVRIHLAMEDSPLPRAIKQVLPMLGDESSHVYVEDPREADLVVCTDIRKVEGFYKKDQLYAVINMPGQKIPTLPSNCVVVNPDNLLIGLIEIIGKTRDELVPIVSTRIVPEMKLVSRTDALRILVIDDTPRHLESAFLGLGAYNLAAVNGYEDAMNVLALEKFDVVLIDLHLPMSSKTMGDKFKLGELVPYRVLLMLEAARNGAKHVAVVTDLSHHDDPFSAAFDHYSRYPVKIENAKVVMMHAPMNQDGSKDWVTALDRLMKE